MTATSLPRAGNLKKSQVFTLFFVMEAAAFAILPLSARSEWMSKLLLFHAGVTTAFLAASWILHRSESGKAFWPVCYVLFAGGMAILVSTIWHMDLTRLFGYQPGSPQETSLAIFFQSLLRVLVVLLLMAIIRSDRSSIYLQKGNLRLGLAVGSAGFLVQAAGAFIPLASQPGMGTMLIKLLPWILLFVLSKGFAEELLFRGLLLKRYEPFLGKGLSNLLAAIVFTLIHVPVNYVPDISQFLVGTFLLAFIWGALMQKTEGDRVRHVACGRVYRPHRV